MLPTLIWVTPDGVTLQEIEEACSRGVRAIQLRDKQRSKEEIRELAHQISNRDLFLLINTYADVALEVGAQGVHLPEADPLPKPSKGLIVGRSVHRVDRELANGCDYLFFGPIFETPSKMAYGPPQGLDRLRQLCDIAPIPVYAIGGVNFQNFSICLAHGAVGGAMQRGIDVLNDDRESTR
jgi:thiamine-phosphate pyrophosphorylase